MKILLTGATGYIGKRLLPSLLMSGHTVICCVRDKNRFEIPDDFADQVEVIEWDFLIAEDPFQEFPKDFDIAYYLIHSMSGSILRFTTLEQVTAHNFRKLVERSKAQQIIYLSGIANQSELSPHLQSRKNVEDILMEASIPTTVLRAGIIVGSGSASFEIIRDLVEKLPVMVAPKWLNTRCQPLAIRDVILYLTRVQHRQDLYNQGFDIGGPDILTYKEMLLGYAKARGLRRYILTVPVMTPRFSANWLYFITSTSYKLAVNLVDSMKVDVICEPNDLSQKLDIHPIPYYKALKLALARIIKHHIPSSWKDSLVSSSNLSNLNQFTLVPTHGCFVNRKKVSIKDSAENTQKRICSIGGDQGWYYATWLWKFRGYLDLVFGGIGLRRGRRDPNDLVAGDSLDFWRVLIVDQQKHRLLLFGEMKLPGEVWMEFKVIQADTSNPILMQTVTFRPSGVFGRIYWIVLAPIHHLLYSGMAKRLAGK